MPHVLRTTGSLDKCLVDLGLFSLIADPHTVGIACNGATIDASSMDWDNAWITDTNGFVLLIALLL